MEDINYGPLRFYIDTWESEGLTGENQAPDTDRKTENTKFRQTMIFEPIGDVKTTNKYSMPFVITPRRGKKESMAQMMVISMKKLVTSFGIKHDVW